MIWTFGKSSVPEAVTWQQLLEETHSDNKLSDVGYFRAQGKKRAFRRQHVPVFTELAFVEGLVVQGA